VLYSSHFGVESEQWLIMINSQRATLSSEVTSQDSPTPRETRTKPPSTRPSQPRLWSSRWVCRCFSPRRPCPQPSRGNRARRLGPSGGMVIRHGTGSRRYARGWTWRERGPGVWCRGAVVSLKLGKSPARQFASTLLACRGRYMSDRVLGVCFSLTSFTLALALMPTLTPTYTLPLTPCASHPVLSSHPINHI
jgi:hypothetical protein